MDSSPSSVPGENPRPFGPGSGGTSASRASWRHCLGTRRFSARCVGFGAAVHLQFAPFGTRRFFVLVAPLPIIFPCFCKLFSAPLYLAVWLLYKSRALWASSLSLGVEGQMAI